MSAIGVSNELGLGRFRGLLAAEKVAPFLSAPYEMLVNGRYYDPFWMGIEMGQKVFSNVYDLGLYLNSILSDCEARAISRNRAFLSWLVLFLFDVLVKVDASG